MPARRAARVDAKALARAVMEHHLGAAPRRVEPASGGLTNDVLEVAHAEGDFVVRIGRGLDRRRLADMLPTMRVFNVLNYAPYVEELAARRDREALAALRLRLAGAFDLYAI